MTEDEFRRGGAPEPDILDFTLPESIPGALFDALVEKLVSLYKPGTTIITPAGATLRAKHAALAVLETALAYYEAVAKEDD